MEIILGDSLVHYEIVNPESQIPVIVLHGWGHSSGIWRPFVGLLSKKFRFYLLDLPGFGQSSLGKSVSGVDDYATLVCDFLDRMGLLKVRLIGHSFGAQIAVVVSCRSTCVTRLVLIAPALVRQRIAIKSFGYFLLSIISKCKRFLPIQLTYHFSSQSNYAAATPRLKEIFKNAIRADVKKLLPTIRAKTLIVWGENDREILGLGTYIAHLVPHSRLKIIYDAGHNLHIDKPNELRVILERYLS